MQRFPPTSTLFFSFAALALGAVFWLTVGHKSAQCFAPGQLHRELRQLVLNLNLQGLILPDLVVKLLTLLAEVIDT